MLFSHGTESFDLAPIERWQALLDRALRDNTLVGVDERAFPIDFATYVRFQQALKRIPNHHPMPPSLSLEQLDEFLSEVDVDVAGA